MDTNRRALLGAVGTGFATALAGCASWQSFDDQIEVLPSPRLGSPAAPVTLKLFVDLASPNSKRFAEQVQPQLVSNYVEPGQVSLEYHDYPIPTQSWSKPAAMSARSVQDHGDDEAFWAYTERLFANQSELSHDLFQTEARELGLNGSRVVNDVQGNVYAPVIETGHEYGHQNGVTGTPAVLINGDLVTPDGRSGDEYYAALVEGINTHL